MWPQPASGWARGQAEPGLEVSPSPGAVEVPQGAPRAPSPAESAARASESEGGAGRGARPQDPRALGSAAQGVPCPAPFVT